MGLVPLLIQTVEKAAAQRSQHALLSEAVAASVLLCHLSMLDSVPGEAFGVCEFKSSVLFNGLLDGVAIISLHL